MGVEIWDSRPHMAVYNSFPRYRLERYLPTIKALYGVYDEGICNPEILKPIMFEMYNETAWLLETLKTAIES
jgi:hypothetical protein